MLQSLTLLRDRIAKPTDDGQISEIAYEETAPHQIVRRFLNDRERFLEQLFRPEDDEPTLFE